MPGTVDLDLQIFRTMAIHTAGRTTKNDFWLESAARRGIDFFKSKYTNRENGDHNSLIFLDFLKC